MFHCSGEPYFFSESQGLPLTLGKRGGRVPGGMVGLREISSLPPACSPLLATDRKRQPQTSHKEKPLVIFLQGKAGLVLVICPFNVIQDIFLSTYRVHGSSLSPGWGQRRTVSYSPLRNLQTPQMLRINPSCGRLSRRPLAVGT